MKANSPKKQTVTWLVKTHTTVTWKWLSNRLMMGHSSNSSRSLNRFMAAEDEEILNLGREMIKCQS